MRVTKKKTVKRQIRDTKGKILVVRNAATLAGLFNPFLTICNFKTIILN